VDDLYAPAPRYGIVAPPAADVFLAPSLLPLQFPSLEAMDARVDAACAQMRAVEGLSHTTIAWVRDAYAAFRRYLKQSEGERTFLAGELARQVRVLDGWVGYLRARDSARSTINTYWRGMRLLCTRLQREDGVVNPFVFRRTPNPGQARLRCLTQSAAEQVLTFVQNDAGTPTGLRARNTAIVGAMLLAGLRKAEVLQLRVSAVDFDSGVVRVFRGKGRHGGKNRTIPMTPQLLEIMRSYAVVRTQMAAGVAEFFLGSRGNEALSDMTLRRLFDRIRRNTGIHVSPHMLRHTFCTLLSKFGIPDRLAREAMGHADYKTLQRYQHVYEGEVAEAMSKLMLLQIDTNTQTATAGPSRKIAA
jgi:site-specific recombinase XerD